MSGDCGLLSNLGIESITVDAIEQQVVAAIQAGDERSNLMRQLASIDMEIAKATRKNDLSGVERLERKKEKTKSLILKLDRKMSDVEKPISSWKKVDHPLPTADVDPPDVARALTLPPKPTIRLNRLPPSSSDPKLARLHVQTVKSEDTPPPEREKNLARNGTSMPSMAPRRVKTANGIDIDELKRGNCASSSSSAPPSMSIPPGFSRTKRPRVIEILSDDEIETPVPSARCTSVAVDGHGSELQRVKGEKDLQLQIPQQQSLYPLDANNIRNGGRQAREIESFFANNPRPGGAQGGGARKRSEPVDWHEVVARKQRRREKKFPDPMAVAPPNDDANEAFYQTRIRDEDLSRDCTNTKWIVAKELRCPLYIWDLLYDYQRQSLQWLLQLHTAHTGGILADEMGLGKTIQVIAFLASLYCSEILQNMTVLSDRGVLSTGGVLLIVPATLMTQWRNEFRTWFPLLRISIMHNVCDSVKFLQMESACDNNGVVITTYQTFRLFQDEILSYPWVYVILDEGHHIRNPDALITAAVKRFHTPHRIILSGSPIQNNLKDLWSVIDFCAPGLLGTFPFFEDQFSRKIEDGAKLCATPIQVEEAYQCAVILRDLTAPHMLRRTKGDVMAMLHLPPKQEHLLFCNLSPEQYQVYVDFLNTDQVKTALAHRGKWGRGVPESFFCISILRKLSNHPDLLLEHEEELRPPDFGAVRRSGKLSVLTEILRIWKRENHKVIVFSQTVMVLEVIQKMLVDHEFTFKRMDGKTPVKRRLNMINEYNKDDTFVLLLTTRVGGVGLNIIGANRVVIFDPDWNPMVDVQARERVWRIGQKREVTVYRLISVGTVEEKMYHRQVFKHFLAQKVLSDSRQRRFFKHTDLKDLFSPPPPPPGFDPSTMRLPKRYMELFSKYCACDKLPLETDAVLGELQLLPLPFQHTPSNEEANEHQSLMLSLIENSCVRSEFSHDKVEQPLLEERLVLHGKVHAQQTLKALRDSTEARNSFPVNTPTWTGRTGLAGREITDVDSSPRKVMGGRLEKNIAILNANIGLHTEKSRVKAKQEGDFMPTTVHLADKKIAESILSYFLDTTKCPFRRACTGSVLNYFNPRVPIHSRGLFKSLLKQMCELERLPSQPGFWRLKEEYS